MPRSARIKSSSNIYHVMIRGNGKETIFFSNEDYNKFCELLDQKVKEEKITLYAWCLMPNHVHLLVKEKDEPLSNVLGGMLSSFVMWYNTKYRRVGHLFQDRFRSRPVEDEIYFLRVMRYIHRNPFEANLCDRMEDYLFSSFSHYFRSEKYKKDDIVLNLMKRDDLEKYHYEKDDDCEFLNIDEDEKITDEKLIQMVMQLGTVEKISDVKMLPRDQRTRVIEMLLRSGASYRQINRIIGVSMGIIRAISREMHQ